MSTFEPTDEQTRIVEAFRRREDLVVEAGAGSGKALRDDQPVLTPHGWRPIGTLTVGDPVIGTDGATYHVTGVFPQGERPLFTVSFSDGTTVVADADHKWQTTTRLERDKGRPGAVRTTREITQTLTYGRRDLPNHWVPMTSPVILPDADLAIDPWLLGVFIGDGSMTSGSPSLSNRDPEIIDRVRALLSHTECTLESNGPDWRVTGPKRGSGRGSGRRGWTNPFLDTLRDLGMYGLGAADKHIPDRYLWASAYQRLALLQGLMDTDGHGRGSTLEWTTVSPKLAEQFAWLVQSLGGVVRCTTKPARYRTADGVQHVTGSTAYRHYVRLPALILPFTLPRKRDAFRARTKYPVRRQIVAITPTAPGAATCISVDSPDRLYLTAGCVPTHNTSTLRLLAAAVPRATGH